MDDMRAGWFRGEWPTRAASRAPSIQCPPDRSGAEPRARALRALWPVFVLAVLCALAAPAQAAVSPVPWQKGEALTGGWVVEDVKRHPEFLRIRVRHTDGRTSGVEIVAATGQGGPWETATYRLQPLPGAEPPPDLLEGTIERLRDLEAAEPAPLVRPQKARDREQAARELPPMLPWLDLLALGLFLALVGVWLARYPDERPRSLALLALAIAWPVVVLALVAPSVIPIDLITPLHEGTGRRVIELVHGQGVHAGPNHTQLVGLLAGDAAVRLRHVVLLNIALHGAAAILFVGLAWRITGAAWAALLLGLAYAASPIGLHVALSELPSALVGLLLLLAVPAGAILARAADWTRAARLLALAQVVVVAALLALTRAELALVGVAALVVAAPAALFGDAPFRALTELARRAVRRVRAMPRWAQVALCAAVILPLAVFDHIRSQGDLIRFGWTADVLLSGLSPLNPEILRLPVVLLESLPLAVVALFVLGLGASVLHLRATLMAPLALVVLFRTYVSSAHAGAAEYEIFRYVTLLSPLALLLAALGFRVAAGLLARRPIGRRARIALAAAFVLTCFVLLPPLPRGNEGAPHSTMSAWLLSRDHQIAVRWQLAQMERHADCVLVAPVIRGEDASVGVRPWDYVIFGGSLTGPVDRHEQSEALELADQVSNGGCVLWVRGYDCSLPVEGTCRAPDGALQVEAAEWQALPYTYRTHTGGDPERVRLALYTITARAAAPR